MARRGRRKPRLPLGVEPDGMGALAEEYLMWLAVRNYSEQTIAVRRRGLRTFLMWSTERSLRMPAEITKPILERYQRHLYHYRKKDGQPLSFRSQHVLLTAVRTYFKWLTRQNFLATNPASELELPKLGQRLPRAVLTRREAEAVIAQCDVNECLGLRDRSILETLYSTGMRRGELVALTLYALDVERFTVMFRQGMLLIDLLIPFGERALGWIQRYVDEVRPALVMDPDEGFLFLTQLGEGFTPDHMTDLVGRYVRGAELGKQGSCHLFRHTMATLMLEGGADIRFIQAMLGHVKLDTTQIYTQVSIRKLKEIHTATHPARADRSPREERDEREECGEDELLASLAAEDESGESTMALSEKES